MPARNTFDAKNQMSTMPKPVYNTPSGIPMIKNSAGFNIAPAVNKETAKKVNAPVDDVLGIASNTDKSSAHYQGVRTHVLTLKEKLGRIDLTDEQTQYINRFKVKYPTYANVPDVELYVKNIQSDKNIFEKYGNIKDTRNPIMKFSEDFAKSTIEKPAQEFNRRVQEGGGGAFDTAVALGQ